MLTNFMQFATLHTTTDEKFSRNYAMKLSLMFCYIKLAKNITR